MPPEGDALKARGITPVWDAEEFKEFAMNFSKMATELPTIALPKSSPESTTRYLRRPRRVVDDNELPIIDAHHHFWDLSWLLSVA